MTRRGGGVQWSVTLTGEDVVTVTATVDLSGVTAGERARLVARVQGLLRGGTGTRRGGARGRRRRADG